MTLLLSIETSTTVCSVAVHQDGRLLANQSLHLNQSHSSLLTPIIESLIKYAGFKPSELSGIIISKGPGSYTGLRIGTSTAKGLCYAFDIPLISVNTLEAMALQIQKYFPDDHLMCPMLDARRMEVYTTTLDHAMNILQETRPLIVEEGAFENMLDSNQIVFFGNGSGKCQSIIKHTNAIFIKDIEPQASTIGFLGYEKFKRQQFEDLAYFEPFYLKEFMATKPKNPF